MKKQPKSKTPLPSPTPAATTPPPDSWLEAIFAGFMIILLVAGILILWMMSSERSKHKAEAKQAVMEARQRDIAFAAAHPIIVEFPISGEGHATKQVGLKAWLNPMRTYLRATEPARYVFIENPEVSFEDVGPIGENSKKWFNMPAGKYLVYPLKGDKIYFRWWQ